MLLQFLEIFLIFSYSLFLVYISIFADEFKYTHIRKKSRLNIGFYLKDTVSSCLVFFLHPFYSLVYLLQRVYLFCLLGNIFDSICAKVLIRRQRQEASII